MTCNLFQSLSPSLYLSSLWILFLVNYNPTWKFPFINFLSGFCGVYNHFKTQRVWEHSNGFSILSPTAEGESTEHPRALLQEVWLHLWNSWGYMTPLPCICSQSSPVLVPPLSTASHLPRTILNSRLGPGKVRLVPLTFPGMMDLSLESSTPALVARRPWTVPSLTNKLAWPCWLLWLNRVRSLPWHSPKQVLSSGIPQEPLPGGELYFRTSLQLSLVRIPQPFPVYDSPLPCYNMINPNALIPSCPILLSALLVNTTTGTKSQIKAWHLPTSREVGSIFMTTRTWDPWWLERPGSACKLKALDPALGVMPLPCNQRQW